MMDYLSSRCPLPLIVVAVLSLGWSGPCAAQSFTEFTVPSADSGPNGIVTGPDSNLWFTERSANKIGRLTPAGVFTEFPLPPNGQGLSSQPAAILVGPDGALWFTMSAASRVGRITTDGVTTFFPTPTGQGGTEGIAVGPDGNIWFTEIVANKIGRLLVGGAHTISEFPVPTPNSRPARITTGPDGNLWFTESQTTPPADKIGRITTGGTITEFPVATANSEPWGIIGSTAAGGSILFTERAASKIALMDLSGTIIFEIPTPTPASDPIRLLNGPDGHVWFTEQDGNNIARIDAHGAIMEFHVPTTGSGPSGMTVGPDGAFWFTEQTASKIARFLPLSSTTQLFAAVLPSSRAIQVGGTATAFATMINASENAAHGCGIALTNNQLPVSNATYQRTDVTNKPVGLPNTPVDIPAHGSQSFVIAATASAPYPSTDLRLGFACSDANAAPIIPGLDTLLYSASISPTPDVVALAATQTNNGIVSIPGDNGAGAFAVATVNVGAAGNITVSANTGAANLPVVLSLCQSNPVTAQCLATPTPSVTTFINHNDTPTFSIFVAGQGTVPFLPALNRIVVRFVTASDVTSGSTSVAVMTASP